MSHLALTAILVDDYDRAISFFTEALGFEVSEDSASTTNDGRPKRWVVVRPPGGETGLLIARADGDEQVRAIGNQFAGRVGLFHRVDDFAEAYERLERHGVDFIGPPRSEEYGDVVVFVDIWGNKWDLLGPG
jgi:catechol 2,3-dioxygenase-like lactoylglutathione lyase family enzyme